MIRRRHRALRYGTCGLALLLATPASSHAETAPPATEAAAADDAEGVTDGAAGGSSEQEMDGTSEEASTLRPLPGEPGSGVPVESFGTPDPSKLKAPLPRRARSDPWVRWCSPQ